LGTAPLAVGATAPAVASSPSHGREGSHGHDLDRARLCIGQIKQSNLGARRRELLAMSWAVMEDKARILVVTYKQSHAIFEYERHLRVRASSSGMFPFCFPRSPCVRHIALSNIFPQLRGGVVGEPGQMAHEGACRSRTVPSLQALGVQQELAR